MGPQMLLYTRNMQLKEAVQCSAFSLPSPRVYFVNQESNVINFDSDSCLLSSGVKHEHQSHQSAQCAITTVITPALKCRCSISDAASSSAQMTLNPG